jgi:hypothetical protein
MDPGTALAIVGLGIDVVKDLHSYYMVRKDRDRDVEEIRKAIDLTHESFSNHTNDARK